MIKGKSAEEIRRTFNITNDFTPEEEAQIKKENVSLLKEYISDERNTHPYPFFFKIRNGLRIVKGSNFDNNKYMHTYTITHTLAHTHKYMNILSV